MEVVANVKILGGVCAIRGIEWYFENSDAYKWIIIYTAITFHISNSLELQFKLQMHYFYNCMWIEDVPVYLSTEIKFHENAGKPIKYHVSATVGNKDQETSFS